MTGTDQDRQELPALVRREFPAGARVTIGRNDAKVAPGSTGVVIGTVSETGNVLVDVDGRGRVAFTHDALTAVDGALTPVATNGAGAREDAAGRDDGGPPVSGRVVHVTDDVAGAVYVGRRYPRRGLPDSAFANPYRIGRDGGRETVLARYRQHALASPSLLRGLPELRDKPLACWCRHDGDGRPGAAVCHGDVLIALLEEHSDEDLRAMAERLEVGNRLRTATFWVSCVPMLALSPDARLGKAIEAVRAHYGCNLPSKVLVHPQTAAELGPREDLKVVAEARVGRYDYWFPTTEGQIRASA
jgi:hypothetical protein